MDRFRANRFVLTFGILLLALAPAATAQTGGGATLVGTVKDSSGSVVAAAKVSVVNTGTSFLSETTTSAEGGYYVPFLNAGNYKITVEANGFKKFVRDGITLAPAQTPRIDITLEVGAVTESIAVTAQASALNTETVDSSFALSNTCPALSASWDRADSISPARRRTPAVGRWMASAPSRRISGR
jgi:hypothetical protein